MAYPDYTSRSPAELVWLAGGTVIVTGRAIGIGEAIARRVAEAGDTVVIGDLDAVKAVETAAALPGDGEHLGLSLDVMDHGSVTALADEAVAKHRSQVHRPLASGPSRRADGLRTYRHHMLPFIKPAVRAGAARHTGADTTRRDPRDRRPIVPPGDLAVES